MADRDTLGRLRKYGQANTIIGSVILFIMLRIDTTLMCIWQILIISPGKASSTASGSVKLSTVVKSLAPSAHGNTIYRLHS